MSEKSIEEVYDDRNLLMLAFARAAYDAGWAAGYYPHDEWVVVFAEIPGHGQVSCHMRPDRIPDEWGPDPSSGGLPLLEADSVFDGHTREAKNRRLREYAIEGAATEYKGATVKNGPTFTTGDSTGSFTFPFDRDTGGD